MPKHSILVVEDESIVALDIQQRLENMGFAVVGSAATGAAAIEKMALSRPSLILMDIQMPVMDGFETTKVIRHWDNEKSKTPIVALTANATQRDIDKCISLGMNDCLTKPFTQEDLLKVIDKYLGSKFHGLGTENNQPLNNHAPIDRVDFSYLEKVSGNNKSFIKEIAEAFLKSIPTSIEELNQHSDNENWTELARVAHKIKPSITLLGVHNLKDKIVKLEEEAKRHINPWLINKLSKEISSELKETLESIKIQINSYS